jgi:hypothetical protein
MLITVDGLTLLLQPYHQVGDVLLFLYPASYTLSGVLIIQTVVQIPSNVRTSVTSVVLASSAVSVDCNGFSILTPSLNMTPLRVVWNNTFGVMVPTVDTKGSSIVVKSRTGCKTDCTRRLQDQLTECSYDPKFQKVCANVAQQEYQECMGYCGYDCT